MAVKKKKTTSIIPIAKHAFSMPQVLLMSGRKKPACTPNGPRLKSTEPPSQLVQSAFSMKLSLYMPAISAPKNPKSTKDINAADRFVVERRIKVSNDQKIAITLTMKRISIKSGVS